MKLWPPVRSRPPEVQREFRGIDKREIFSLSEPFSTDEINLGSDYYPALIVRPGSLTLGAVGTRVLGLGIWKDTEIHAVFNDGTWRKWTGSAWSAALASGLNTSAEWSFANFKGNLAQISLIGTNGVDAPHVYDGTAVTTLATAPDTLNYIEQYADRLYGAVGNDLKFTAYRMANDWTAVNGDDADSGYITIETPNGETITGIKASSSHVTVFKPSSIHELFGTSPNDYRMIQVCKGIGMANNKHAVNIGGILYFIDVTNPGIYQYDGGNLPSKAFSEPVRWYIESINQAAKMASCVGTDGNKLYIGIPINGVTPDTILVYDFRAKAWNVWTGFTPLFFAKMGVEWFMGDAAGRVKKLGYQNADDGQNITWRRVSIPYSAQSLSQKLRLMRAWFTATVYAGSTFNVYISKQEKGDSDWTLLKSISAQSTLINTPIYVPTSIAANATWIRVKIEGTGPMEVKEFARDMQAMPVR